LLLSIGVRQEQIPSGKSSLRRRSTLVAHTV